MSEIQRLAQQAAAARAAAQAPPAKDRPGGAEPSPAPSHRATATKAPSCRSRPPLRAPRVARVPYEAWHLAAVGITMLVVGFAGGSSFKLGSQLEPIPPLPIEQQQ